MVKIKIAEIVISVCSSNPDLVLDMPQVYRQFSTSDPSDIFITADLVDRIPTHFGNPVFLSKMTWDLFEQDGKWIIPLYSPPDSTPYQVAILEHDFKHGQLLVCRKNNGRHLCYPLSFPLDEILMINFFSRGVGVVLHSCGVALHEFQKGFLFTGMSGAGKSTLTRVWQQRPGNSILSDDRVVLRKKDSRYWIYGTPWHGDALGSSACTVPVDNIYILKQAPVNSLTLLKPVEAAAKLLARSFPTFWDPGGMAFTLEYLDELSQNVPCYEFGFLPDQSAIEFILQNLHA